MRELPWIYIARQRSRLTIFPIEQVQSLLEDIKDVRWDKVEKGLKTLSGRTHAVKLKNLSAMEVNRMRTFTVRALQSFFKHDNDDMMKQTPTDSDSQSTPTSSDRLPRRTLRPR